MPATAKLETLVSDELNGMIRNQAESEGLSVSAYIRRILTIWHDPDRVTLERCRTLVDSREVYDAAKSANANYPYTTTQEVE